MAFYIWTTSDGFGEYEKAIDFCDTVVGVPPAGADLTLSPKFINRVSRVHYPAGSPATKDKLWSQSSGYDEITKADLSSGNTGWWEHVIYNCPQNLILAFAYNITSNLTSIESTNLDRIIRAARDNPRVKIAVEAYHFSVYGNVDTMRLEERRMRNQLNNNLFPMGRVIVLVCATDRPDIAAKYDWSTGLAYSSRQPQPYLSYVADRDCVKDWWLYGCRDFGVWGLSYASQSSRDMVSKAIIRGIELAGVNLM